MISNVIVEKVYNLFDYIHNRRLRNYYFNHEIDAVIDVGSHKGEFILSVFQNTNLPIFSFEPQDIVREQLHMNTKGYNIKYYKYALSDKNHDGQLYLNSLSSTSTLNVTNDKSLWIKFKKFILGKDTYHGVQKVICKKLDDVLINEIEKFTNVLLKVDVEGSEGKVLVGAKNILSTKKIKFVQLEKSSFDIYNSKYHLSPARILMDQNFKLQKEFLFPLLNFKDIIFIRS